MLNSGCLGYPRSTSPLIYSRPDRPLSVEDILESDGRLARERTRGLLLRSAIAKGESVAQDVRDCRDGDVGRMMNDDGFL